MRLEVKVPVQGHSGGNPEPRPEPDLSRHWITEPRLQSNTTWIQSSSSPLLELDDLACLSFLICEVGMTTVSTSMACSKD